MSPCSIRPATRDDAEPINDIQNYYVAHSTATFLTEPLTLEQRLAWLGGRSRAHPVVVAQIEGSVVGMTDSSPWLFLTRPISGVLLFLSVASVAFALWQRRRQQKSASASGDADF